MVMDFPTYQQISSLRAGSKVTLAETEGIITISAADAQDETNAIEAELTALGARVTTLEGTTQPMLTNGPQPDPPGQLITLVAPELARIDRTQVNYGLVLERVLPGGYGR